jgi:pimeloyl-ACP methyl ester carboxylesterase
MSRLACREAMPAGAPAGTLLCLHGYPESSWMWNAVLEAAAGAGWHAVAPDLPGYGDSPYDGPATWDRHLDALAGFIADRDLAPLALCLHDWGGLIGLRWACEHAGDLRGLVISATGFFPDGRWHGLAEAMRTPGQGEELVAGIHRDGFGAMLRGIAPGIDDAAIDEYFKAFDGDDRRRGQLELYRSGDFAILERYDLGVLGVPALLLWGADDAFAPVASAHRFAAELPAARLEVLDGVGHFLFDDAPERTAAAVAGFLRGL